MQTLETLMTEGQNPPEKSLWWRTKEFSKDALIWVIFYGICMLPVWLLCKFIGIFFPSQIHVSNDFLLMMMALFWWNSVKNSNALENQIMRLHKKVDALKQK